MVTRWNWLSIAGCSTQSSAPNKEVSLCVKFFVSCFIVCLLCFASLVVSFGETPQGYMTITTDTSTGATNRQTTYPLPFYGSAWGANATDNHYVFFSFEPQDNGYLYFETTDSNVTVNASLSNIVYDNGNFGVPIITNLGDGLYRLSLDPSSSGAKKVGFSIYLSKVRIAYAFLSVNKHDTLADVLAELQQFHTDVNSSLDDIYSILPFTPSENITFGICSPTLISDEDIDISYDDAMSFINALNYHYALKQLPFVNSSGLTTNLRDVVNFYYDSSHTSIGVYVVRNGSPIPYNLCLYDNDNDVVFKFNVFSSGVASAGLNNSTGSLNNQAQQNEALESQFTGSMTSNFNALNLSNFDFNSDTFSGMALVGTIFENIWNSFGKWNIIFSFPLFLGIVLLLVGRISKSAGNVRRENAREARRAAARSGGKKS